jgi:hypothetical protein
MIIKEKVEMQKRNTATVYLHKEGIFYKAYNEGAYLLNFLKYKVSVNHIKKLNQTVYSIGFPLAVLDNLAETYTISSNQNTVQIISPIEVFDNELYDIWCSSIATPIHTHIDVKDEVESYPLATSTPIEAYLWLYNLQKRIVENG